MRCPTRFQRPLAQLATTLAAAAMTLTATTATAQSSPPEKIALTGGRIIPVVGEEIESGTIIIERGVITAIGGGDDVDIPYDATEIDVTGKVLMPGMIDAHTARGMDIANENAPVTPFLDVYDAIDPSQLYFESSLREGITALHIMPGNNTVIGGTSRVVRPIGMTVNEMTIMPQVGLKISTTPKRGFDRMSQLATLRETFLELDDYLERLAETKYEESLAEKDEKIDVGPEEARKRGKELITDQDYDDQHNNLIRLRRGDLQAWMHVGSPMDVGPAVQLANDQGLMDHTVFVVGGNTYKAIKEIARTKRPVVLPGNLFARDRDPISGEIEEVFLPTEFHDAGILFAITPNPDASMAERYLNYQAALMVRNGIPRNDALEAITINPATILGLEESHGSLEVGKTANIVVMSGDPLDFSTWVEQVLIDGIVAYDREKDWRLKELLAVDQANRAVAAEEAVSYEADDEENEDAAESDSEESTNDADAEDAESDDDTSDEESANDEKQEDEDGDNDDGEGDGQ